MASAADRPDARVRVVVVNYDGGDVTLRCLDALARTEWPPELLEIVLVDNASTDGVVAEVRRSRPAVTVIESTENEGFGRACNRAMTDLTGIDHVALMNNDALPEPGWLAPLVSALHDDSGLGAVCPKVLLDGSDRPDDVINSVGGVLYEGWFGGDRGYLEPDRGQYDMPAEVFSWSGAAVLLRAAYLRDVGLFNPALFLYYEDFELSWRGRLRGWRYRTVPSSLVRHRHGHSTEIGSERFKAWEDRSRWVTLLELAPIGVAIRATSGGLRRGIARHEARLAFSGLWAALRGRRRLGRGRRRTRMDRWLTPRTGPPTVTADDNRDRGSTSLGPTSRQDRLRS